MKVQYHLFLQIKEEGEEKRVDVCFPTKEKAEETAKKFRGLCALKWNVPTENTDGWRVRDLYISHYSNPYVHFVAEITEMFLMEDGDKVIAPSNTVFYFKEDNLCAISATPLIESAGMYQMRLRDAIDMSTGEWSDKVTKGELSRPDEDMEKKYREMLDELYSRWYAEHR